MKRRCVPLRADHDLLTPDTHTLSGVRLHPVIQVRSQGVASLSGYLSDLSSSESAAGSSRRRLATSPTRRLRFEDETETEAESRYLERQRKRGGQRGAGALLSKPDLNLYIKGGAGAEIQGTKHVVDRYQRSPCGGVRLNLCLHSPVSEDRGRSLNRPHLNLWTEPIRETYIGSITPDISNGGGAGARRRTNQMERNGNQMTIPQTTPTTDLPINPYASDQLTTSTCPYFLSPPPVTSVLMSQRQEEQRRPAAAEPHRELPSGAELRERSPGVEEGGLDPRVKSSSSGRSSETAAESQAPPTSGSRSDGQVRQPMRAEVHSDIGSLPECLSRDESSRLSLRRLLSNVRLSRTRTGSLDRLSSQPRPLVPDSTPSGSSMDRLSSQPRPLVPDSAPSGSKKSSGLLQKSPSVQSLCVQVSPFFQLRKSWSVQTLFDQQKKKMMADRSCDYKPAAQLPQRCLSLEDVGCPSSVRSVGRVLQICSDGTVLLEVSRPESRMYGFIIGRRRGQHDSGVYVEDMVDSSTEKLYAGLLAVGDEILEVNGKKVSGLSLDQVTHQLNQNISVTVRVLRHRQTPPR